MFDLKLNLAQGSWSFHTDPGVLEAIVEEDLTLDPPNEMLNLGLKIVWAFIQEAHVYNQVGGNRDLH